MAEDILDQGNVQPSPSVSGGCTITSKWEAATIAQGVTGAIDHIMRDAAGNVIDLTALVAACAATSSDSGSEDDEAAGPCGIYMRAREGTWINRQDQVYEVQAQIVNAATGAVRASLPSEVTDNPAVYELQWGAINVSGQLIMADTSFLIVEPSLWATQATLQRGVGPPTLKEVRLTMKDSSPLENPLNNELEFSDIELLYALIRPVKQYREHGPSNTYYTTRNFPWREYWIKAVQANLYEIAAAFYRRNRQQTSGRSGVSIDHRNKEREYMEAAARLSEEWLAFIQQRKVIENARASFGRVPSLWG